MATKIEEINWTHWIYRLIALIIDSIIAGIIGGIIYSVLLIPILIASVVSGAGIFAAPWWAGSLLFPFIYGIILLVYSAILEGIWDGMTIGKRLLGLQVQTVNGGKVPMDKAFIRNLSKIYWILLLLDWLLGILTPGNKQQKYSDRLAGTVVVQRKSAFTSTPPPPPTSTS